MADNDQSQEKNQDPTQKRLDKAKEDGEILTSKEMFVFGSSVMGLIVLFTLGMFSKGILSGWSSLFAWDHAENLETLRIFNAENRRTAYATNCKYNAFNKCICGIHH